MKGAPHPHDVILCCRQYVASNDYCQPPCVFAKHDMFEAVPHHPEVVAGRSAFSDRQRKEFHKTAVAISQAPWCLHEATGYLLKLLQDNADMQSDDWVPPFMEFGFEAPMPNAYLATAPVDSVVSEALHFANRDPAKVHVQQLRGKKRSQAETMASAKKEVEMPDPELAGDPELPDAADVDCPDVPDLPDADQPCTEGEPDLPDADDNRPGPADPGLGAPPALRGVRGAAAGVFHDSPGRGLKRPAAAAKSTPKAKAKGKAKAKARVGSLPFPPGAVEALQKLKDEGHNKCRGSKHGCTECRKKAGLKLNDDQTAWIWDPAGPPQPRGRGRRPA